MDGRSIAHSLIPIISEGEIESPLSTPRFILSDRAVAIWALACLVAIVPAGIAGLQLVLH